MSGLTSSATGTSVIASAMATVTPIVYGRHLGLQGGMAYGVK